MAVIKILNPKWSEGSEIQKWIDIPALSPALANYLAKDNEEEYIPTGDYNPATKKYVDERFPNIVKDIYSLTKVLNSASDNTEGEWNKGPIDVTSTIIEIFGSVDTFLDNRLNYTFYNATAPVVSNNSIIGDSRTGFYHFSNLYGGSSILYRQWSIRVNENKTVDGFVKSFSLLSDGNPPTRALMNNGKYAEVVLPTDSRLTNSRPASDVSAWAKATNKPSYSWTEIRSKPTFATVATSGSYNDLSNKPTIPAAYTLPASTTGALGGIKVGYTTSGKNYKVQLDSSNNAYVNVPWTDNNTTYAQATSDKLGLVKIGYSANGKNYPVSLDSGGKMYVNVPWTDTNTTYSNMGAATATAAGKAGLVPAPGAGKQTSFLRGDGTWATPPNTTYSVATTSANGLMSSSDKSRLDKLTGISTVTTLASLPITKRSIVATVTAATSLSLASNLELGQELYIRIYNNSSSAITQPIPNSGNFVSMNGTSVSIPSKSFIEMSIWCYESGKYSIRIGEIA